MPLLSTTDPLQLARALTTVLTFIPKFTHTQGSARRFIADGITAEVKKLKNAHSAYIFRNLTPSANEWQRVVKAAMEEG